MCTSTWPGRCASAPAASSASTSPPTPCSPASAPSPSASPCSHPAPPALITRFLTTPAPGGLLAPPERLADLTPREREVTALAAQGKSNAEIAGDLVLSVLAIRTHIQRALTELGARDRAQLVVIASQTGRVRPAVRDL